MPANTAKTATAQHVADSLALIERIKAELEKPQRPGANWGDAGTAAYRKQQLQEISDSMFNEGEYAE